MNQFFKTHWVSLLAISVLLGLLWGAINAASDLAAGVENTVNGVVNAPANAFTSFWAGAYNFVAGIFGQNSSVTTQMDSNDGSDD